MMKKRGFLNFNMFLALIVLIPSAMLLVQYLGALGKACGAAQNTVIFAIVAGCMLLLASMTIMKELLTN